MKGRIGEVGDKLGPTLSFGSGEVVDGEDWSGQKLGRITSGAYIQDSSFAGSRVKQLLLGGAGDVAVFVNCSFEKARLNFIIGEAKFIKCSFRDAHLKDFRVNPLMMVDCDFSGSVLRECQFWGSPTPRHLKEHPDLVPLNEVYGNDFSDATFSGSSFRGGVDLTKQHLPDGEEYAMALDGFDAIALFKQNLTG